VAAAVVTGVWESGRLRFAWLRIAVLVQVLIVWLRFLPGRAWQSSIDSGDKLSSSGFAEGRRRPVW
jgi:hypothetical protein